MKVQTLDLHLHSYSATPDPAYDQMAYLEPTGQENNCFYHPDQTLSSSLIPPDLQ